MKTKRETKGVYICKRTGKWRSYITHEGKNTYLGLFDTPEEAREVFLKAKSKIKEMDELVITDDIIKKSQKLKEYYQKNFIGNIKTNEDLMKEIIELKSKKLRVKEICQILNLNIKTYERFITKMNKEIILL